MNPNEVKKNMENETTLEFRNKKYRVVDDIEYRYVKKIKRLRKEIRSNNDVEDDGDEKLILLLSEALCPDLKITFSDNDGMLIDGEKNQKIKFGEVELLLSKLVVLLNQIQTRQIAYAFSPKKKSNESAPKNGEKATGA